MPTVDEIFRDFVVDGAPISGAHQPIKAEIRALLSVLSNIRTRLTANRTYYVRDDGNDGNDGLANVAGTGVGAGAFLTIQRAYNVIAGTLDLGGFIVTIRVIAGTYSNGLLITQPWTGGGTLIIQGDGATTHINTSSVVAGGLRNLATLPGQVTFRDMRVTAPNYATIYSSGPGLIGYVGITFEQTSNYHVAADAPGAFIFCAGPCTINGGAAAHFLVSGPARILAQSLMLTVNNTPHFGAAFAYLTRVGLLTVDGLSFSPTAPAGATGKSHTLDSNSTIFGTGGNLRFFPSSSDGVSDPSGVLL